MPLVVSTQTYTNLSLVPESETDTKKGRTTFWVWEFHRASLGVTVTQAFPLKPSVTERLPGSPQHRFRRWGNTGESRDISSSCRARDFKIRSHRGKYQMRSQYGGTAGAFACALRANNIRYQ